MQILNQLRKTYDTLNKYKIFPDLYSISGSSTGTTAVVNGKEDVFIFCSNNYLGLSNLSRVNEAIKKGVDMFGMGSGGSRLISGNISVQEELEKTISKFLGAESAITFSSGFATNIGIIPALLKKVPLSLKEELIARLKFRKKNVVVFSDALNHASIVDGCRHAKSQKVIYKHCDVKDLEKQLLKNHKATQKLIITDGVFSMDGDVAPLDKIVNLAEQFDAIVLVDDAHAVGVLGGHGRGTLEHFELENNARIIQMGTFTKAFGGVGGFVVGPKWLMNYLRVSARSYIFSAPIPPAIANGIIASIKINSEDSTIRAKLWENIAYIKNILNKEQFNILGSSTQIIPIIIGDEEKSNEVARFLFDNNILLPSVRWPATERGNARLRLTMSSDHNKEQIDYLLTKLLEAKRKFNF